VRTPLSWLRDFAPFQTDAATIAAALDDLGLVVEGIERVGEGLDEVSVARVVEIRAIEGADRIRRVVVDSGDEPVEVVCGAWNFAEGDLVPLVRAGAVLPGGIEIARRTMRGVVSNGMLCSGRELSLSADGEGLLVLTDVEGAVPGQALTDALGIEPDVVFDITVEGNRPDAWCVAGIARDLAARLGVPFALPESAPGVPVGGPPVDGLASAVVESPALCPRLTVRVATDVTIAPSPRWLARRLILSGMRPINNVVDASNYVMLELGQPTHPYDLDRVGGSGLRVRRARRGERLVTLDGTSRELGVAGSGLGETGEDCVICDAHDAVIGVAGIMGGESSEISGDTRRVLLEAAYFAPMAIARTAKRLRLRTEASSRFERGCDPWGIDRATDRFFSLVALSAPDMVVATGALNVRGEVPQAVVVPVRVAAVNALLGTELGSGEVSALLEPLGFVCTPVPAEEADGDELSVVVPTNRPDIRPAPHGVADVAEEVARTYGYSRIDRHQPTWPQPGGLTARQRDRRAARQVCLGLGASEAWTPSFVADDDHRRIGLTGPAVEVTNPLATEERFLRRAQLPGLLRALAYNADRRQGAISLFEIGTVFSVPDEEGAAATQRAGAGGAQAARLPIERELLSVVWGTEGADARHAVAAWHLLRDALGLAGVRAEQGGEPAGPGLHPTRSARLVESSAGTPVGTLGEVDPSVVASFGLGERRVGWLEVDLGLLLDPGVVARRSDLSRPVSRFPSSDIDLALVVADEVPADRVADELARAGGDLLESVTLFDVYRGKSLPAGTRSLAYRLRFCAHDRTLTDGEVGELRRTCVEAAQRAVGATLR
jgi:phenylalanyl-tRNA synthetase beta chain